MIIHCCFCRNTKSLQSDFRRKLKAMKMQLTFELKITAFPSSLEALPQLWAIKGSNFELNKQLFFCDWFSERPQIIAISLETAIQNGGIAFVVIGLTFPSPYRFGISWSSLLRNQLATWFDFAVNTASFQSCPSSSARPDRFSLWLTGSIFSTDT